MTALGRRAAGGLVRHGTPRVQQMAQRARRVAFAASTRAAARAVGATVDLQLADDLLVGKGVRVTFEPGSSNVLRIGIGCRLEDRVLVMLKGGTIDLGDEVQ